MPLNFFDKKILPAVTFPTDEDVRPVTEAILKGGLDLMEVPFRTPAAASAIRNIRKTFPQMNIGAGTVLSVSQLQQAIDAGAKFALSPGFNPSIVKEAAKLKFLFIPGVMTPSEIEIAYQSDCTVMKLFPAEQIGGVGFLKALQGPYEHLDLKFIPMGGVHLQNMNDYLKLKNVIAIGGSWIASKKLIVAKDYDAIEKNVREALSEIDLL